MALIVQGALQGQQAHFDSIFAFIDRVSRGYKLLEPFLLSQHNGASNNLPSHTQLGRRRHSTRNFITNRAFGCQLLQQFRRACLDLDNQLLGLRFDQRRSLFNAGIQLDLALAHGLHAKR